MRAGSIVLLNGASSSGKSTLAEGLATRLPGPWFVMSVDAFGAMRSDLDGESDDEVAAALRRTRLGYHRAVAGMAAAGNDVLMDYPLSEGWRLDDLLDVLGDLDVLVVEVRCSPAELARREQARGDRPVGLAASQTSVYGRDHDVAVDTSEQSPHDCVESVVDALARTEARGAWERMRRARGVQR